MTVVLNTSAQVKLQGKTAWSQMQATCNSFMKSMHGIFTFFKLTVDCKSAIDHISAEYPEKVSISGNVGGVFLIEVKVSSQPTVYTGKPHQISKCIHAEIVYFPEDIEIETFAIIMPLSMLGEVEIEGRRVDTDHYYHILDGC